MSETTPNSNPASSSILAISFAWLIVILPAAWGVYNTALRAANLFK